MKLRYCDAHYYRFKCGVLLFHFVHNLETRMKIMNYTRGLPRKDLLLFLTVFAGCLLIIHRIIYGKQKDTKGSH